MAKYRKKPVEIEAVMFTGDNHEELAAFMGVNDIEIKLTSPPQIVIKTLEGDMTASQYDFIIKGVKKEFYPCKPDIFEQTYEKV